MDASKDELEAEFAMLMRRAGITLPPDRRAAVFAGFLDLRTRVEILHAHKPPALESAHVFDTLNNRSLAQ